MPKDYAVEDIERLERAWADVPTHRWAERWPTVDPAAWPDSGRGLNVAVLIEAGFEITETEIHPPVSIEPVPLADARLMGETHVNIQVDDETFAALKRRESTQE